MTLASVAAAGATAAHPATKAVPAKVATVVPASTKTVTAADIASVVTHGSTETITLNTAVPVKAGDIIVAGIGTATPDGLIAKVTHVSGLTLTAKPATLRQAVPQGSFSATATFAAVKSGSLAKNLPCGAGGGVVPFTGDATVTVKPTISASWTAKSATVTIGAAASGTAEVAAALNPDYICAPGASYIGGITRLAPFQITVGSIPVVVTPMLRWTAQATINTTQFATADVTQTFSESASLTDSNGRYSAHGAGSARTANHYVPNFAPSRNLVSVTLAPRVTMGLFGHSGPMISIGIGSKLITSGTTAPWWSADATQGATASASTPDLALGSSTRTLNSHVTVAAHAATARTGLSVYQTYGSFQGAVTGRDGRVWMVAYAPTAQQGPPAGSQMLDAVNPVTLAVSYYGPLIPHLGSANSPTLLAYTNGAPAFDGGGNAWLIATATTPGGARSHRLVRFNPGSGKNSTYAISSSCQLPEGLASAGDGSVWLRCGSASGNATPKVMRITSSGSMRLLNLSGPHSIGSFAPGAGGTMWAVGYNAAGRSTGLVRYSPSGGESYFGTPGGYSARGVAGNGSGRVIEIAACGSSLCYLSVSTGGGLRRVAVEPGSASSVRASYGPAMDSSGNVWTLNDGSVARTGQYFLELTSGNGTRVYAFSTPGGCGQLSIAGSPAAADGSAWAESNSYCTFIGNTSGAYPGALLRYLP